MKITVEFLKEKNACSGGLEWFEANFKEISHADLINRLIESKEKEKLQWANWLLSKLFDRKQKIQYAIFAAEQVIDIYEKKYPYNKQPREAIEVAKKVLKNDTQENRAKAYAAADAADAAYAAAYAANAAYAAYAAYAAANAAYAADLKETRIKILNYFVEVMK